jgi:hypothetical protein
MSIPGCHRAPSWPKGEVIVPCAGNHRMRTKLLPGLHRVQMQDQRCDKRRKTISPPLPGEVGDGKPQVVERSNS